VTASEAIAHLRKYYGVGPRALVGWAEDTEVWRFGSPIARWAETGDEHIVVDIAVIFDKGGNVRPSDFALSVWAAASEKRVLSLPAHYLGATEPFPILPLHFADGERRTVTLDYHGARPAAQVTAYGVVMLHTVRRQCRW